MAVPAASVLTASALAATRRPRRCGGDGCGGAGSWCRGRKAVRLALSEAGSRPGRRHAVAATRLAEVPCPMGAEAAVEWLELGRLRSLPPGVKDYGDTMRACILDGRMDLALEFLDEMLQSSLEPDARTYKMLDANGANGALQPTEARAQRWAAAKEAAAEAEAQRRPPEVSSVALGALSLTVGERPLYQGRHDTERIKAMLVRRMGVDVSSALVLAPDKSKTGLGRYSLAVNCRPPAGGDVAAALARRQQGLQGLRKMRQARLAVKEVSYQDLLVYNRQWTRWAAALHCLGEMRLVGLEVGNPDWQIVQRTCKSGRAWDVALEFLVDASRRGLEVNSAANRVAISALKNPASRWRKALALLHSADAARLPPSVVSCNAAAGACFKAGRWLAVLRLLQDMRYSGLRADSIMLNALLGALGRQSRWELALQVLGGAAARGDEVDETSFYRAIDICEQALQWPRVPLLLQQMLRGRLEPDAQAFTSSIDALCKIHGWRESLALQQDALDDGLSLGAESYEAVATACRRTRLEWRRALELTAQAPRQRLEPRVPVRVPSQNDVVSNPVLFGISFCFAAFIVGCSVPVSAVPADVVEAGLALAPTPLIAWTLFGWVRWQ